MGGSKRQHEEMTVGGLDLYAATGKAVCAVCIAEEDIAAFIDKHASEMECDFCDRESEEKPIAADLVEVVRFMDRCLAREYGHPEGEGVRWVSSEGGWQGSVLDTWDLLADHLQVELPDDAGNELLGTLCRALGDRAWCCRDPYGMTRDKHLSWSWEHFCEYIKHERRYFFREAGRRATPPAFPDHEPLEPEEMLKQLAEMCIEHGLICPLDSGTVAVRARPQGPGKTYNTARDLGPPPKENARQANRMSPAGIPIFYGATDEPTVVAEVQRDDCDTYAVGTFELTMPIWALDLTRVPPLPGPFCDDDKLAAKRPILMFLHSFARDVSLPIAGDREVHIEYVPTQVVTEYFRVAVKHKGAPITAVLYNSAKNAGGTCMAVFVEQADVADSPSTTPGKPLLVLRHVKVVKR